MLVKLFLVSLILGVTLAQDGHFDDPYANDKDFLKVEASGHDAANRTRVAILGGGMGGLSTAYYLSTGANAGKYNITIYQLGWRLGGKAATGRNPEFGNRLEEKGIHMLFGFYERVFGILSEVYNSLNRPPSHPLSSLNVGLRGQNGLCMNDPVIGKELNLWCTFLPVRGNDPWNRTKLGYDFYNINGNDDPYRALIFGLEKLEQYQTITFNNTRDVPTVLDISQVAQQCSQVYNNAEAFYYSDADDIVCKPQLKRLQAVIRENYHSGLIDELRRLLIEANLGLSIVFGLIEVRPSSFFDPVLDQYDFRAWLLMYGLLPEFKDSPPLNAIYMTSFCYVNGNRSDPNFAAGIAMLSMFNAFLDYEGHFGYYFIGGTGEVVFAPIYERLVQLGVKFEFFHKVESLNPSADNQSIESVDIAVQAQLKNPSAGYYPFIIVDSELGKLEAWPNDPNWDQLVNGANLTNYDFESYYKTNYPTTPKKLKQGVDYDAVVLAISLGALPYITPKMMAVNPKWNAMVNGIKTTPTFGVQIWFNQSSSQLMVPAVAPPNEFSIASYVVPLDGVGDFSHVLPSEGWGNYSNPPQSVFYLCQAWEPLPGPHPLNETDYPDKENQHLIDVTIEWMNAGNFKLIPGAVNADNTLNYNLLVDPTGSSGVQRLKNQAFITKVDPPTELYVLSGSQTLQYRIKPNESGFSNLYLAGDWTNNDLNYGCLEATVSSGQIAAGAIAFNYNKETL